MRVKALCFNILEGETLEVKQTPYGAVGTLYTDDRIEAVWVSKQYEAIDPDWFSSPVVDLIIVMQGKLKVEFEAPDEPSRVLEPGELMVLPPLTRCRAYRWPRESKDATVFLAVYPGDVTQAHGSTPTWEDGDF